MSSGGIKALQGINIEARAGEITGVIGPNGAGKTSLFNAISGFYAPNRGTVSFEGRDIIFFKENGSEFSKAPWHPAVRSCL